MNKQRKVLITITYNEMGIIIDTKAEELGSSAQLGTNLAEVGTDLISRQAAINATWKEPSYTDPLNVLTEVRDRIEALPSTQPEIIRCKDCARYVPSESEFEKGTCDGRQVSKRHFCGYAKRRANDGK